MLHERDFAVLHVYKDTEIALYREREKGSMCYLSMCVLSQHTCVSKVGSCMHLWAPIGRVGGAVHPKCTRTRFC